MENDFSIDSYVRFASTQGIEALMITGFLKSGIVVSADIRKKLYGAVLVSMRQI